MLSAETSAWENKLNDLKQKTGTFPVEYKELKFNLWKDVALKEGRLSLLEEAQTYEYLTPQEVHEMDPEITALKKNIGKMNDLISEIDVILSNAE